MQNTLVIASRNNGKVIEIRELLKDFSLKIAGLNDFGPIPEIEEDGKTFDENAYKKASFTSKILGMPVLADDSGLSVEALGGAPGIYSARYGGEDTTDEKNCLKLLETMKGKTNRRADFECVISIAVPTGAALTYEGRCEGMITTEPSGTNGFGYDPIFYFPSLGKTFAELTRVEKNRVSHRGKAFSEFRGEFDKILTWINQQMPVFEKFHCNDENA